MKLVSRFKRIISVMLLVLILSSSVGCYNEQPEESSLKPVEESSGIAVDANGYELDDLPEVFDFDVEEVDILHWDNAGYYNEFDIEVDSSSGIIDQAAHTRNLTLESRLGVVINWHGTHGDTANVKNFVSVAENSFSAGEKIYDLYATYTCTTGALTTRGLTMDLFEIEDSYINLNKPWYSSTLSDDFMIKDSLYFVASEASYLMLMNMYAVIYNRDMVRSKQFTDPIEYVTDDNWTLDTYIEWTSGSYSDTNNNGSIDENDTFGMTNTAWHNDAFYTGSGLKLINKKDDGTLELSSDFTSIKAVDLVDKMGMWMSTPDVYITSYDANHIKIFNDGRSLSQVYRIYGLDIDTRNADFDYAVVPIPKYDSNQSCYYTCLGNPFSLFSVPVDCENTDLSSATIECWSSQGYRGTTPAVFEQSFKLIYSQDSDVSRMFDIIRESVVFDLGRIFASETDKMSEKPSYAMVNSDSWAVLSKRYSEMLKGVIKDINESFE